MQGISFACRALGGLALLAGVSATPASDVVFNEAEIRAILLHGPWPAPATRDPSNRVSGNRAAIELGEGLFFDTRLSATGKFACATCHVPERNWTDNRARGAAVADVDRNTPTLMNVRLGRWFGWAGGADSLWSQSIRPILDARELGSTARHVADLVRNDNQLACRYRRSFGDSPSPSDDDRVLADIGKALAAFQETFESPATPFDRFRDALARGGSSRPELYSEAARRGLRIFIGKGNCSTCHGGPNFTRGEFHDNGFSAYAAQGRIDGGRVEGLKEVQASRFNLLGSYNDDPSQLAPERMRAAPEKGRPGAFKVPTLRHLMLTPPYGHHGDIDTLADVVRHYSERGSPDVKPLRLSGGEQSDLVVFLESLSTMSNPWRSGEAERCY
jgi:cytochrome c peroxidase